MSCENRERGHMFHHRNCGHQQSTDCGCGRHHGGDHHSAQCGCGAHFKRRFQTKEEKVKWLEQYLESLQKEAQAVQERLAELGKA